MRVRRWWQRRFVGLAKPEQGDGELCVGWHTFEYAVAQLKQLLPIRKSRVEEFQSTPDERVCEEADAHSCSHAFHDHVVGDEGLGGKYWYENGDEAEAVGVVWKRRRWGQRIAKSLPRVSNIG